MTSCSTGTNGLPTTPRKIVLPLVLTAAILAVLSYLAWNLYTDFKSVERQHHRIIELKGIITHYDEVLTMSARMAAATGNLRWESRYRRFEPQLDLAIREALTLAPEGFVGESFAQTDAANIKLAAMENKAFDLVRHEDLKTAEKVLYSPEYQEQKHLYSEGMAQGATALEEFVEHKTVRYHRVLLAAFIFVAFIISLAIFAWFAALRMRKDIAKRKQVEHELERLNERLEVSVEKANRLAHESTLADLAKSQFLANMSHEIRTPMNAIIGFSEVLSEESLTDEQLHHVKIIRESARHLLQLMNDILDFSKIETGKLDIEITDCSLPHVLAVIESLMRPAAKEKGLAFEVLQCDELPAQVRTDPLRLRQCLVNLISNAIKFTEEGHVYVNVSVQNKIDGPFICFDIEDTGIGIAPDKEDLIFEEFTQADAGTTRRYSGTGLGLPITKKLASLLGGQLTVTSEVGKGSVFSLTIPAGVDVESQVFNKYDAASELKHELDSADTPVEARFSGRVLVAEDSKSNQMLVKLLLQRLGLEVIIAEDGKEAVRKALSESFNLILMDIQMPNMDGHEATKILRRKGLKTAIVAMTAYAMKGDDKKCIASGCTDYMAKPIDTKILLQVIRKYLPCQSKVSSAEIDSANSEVEQLGQEICGCVPQGEPGSESSESQGGRQVIDWTYLVDQFGNERRINEIVEAFFVDNPAHIESLPEAIKAGNAADVQAHAHAVKGSAATIGAKSLAQTAHRLELAAGQQNLEMAEALFADIQTEFQNLKSFLAKPGWMEIAKRQQESCRVEQIETK